MSNKPELKLINMADVEATEVEWLWYPYIPYGKITIIQGDPGEGKTTLILNRLRVAMTTFGPIRRGQNYSYTQSRCYAVKR